MDIEDFRKAELIELHDAGVVVHPHDYSAGAAGWYEWSVGSPSISVVGDAVEMLLKAAGIEPDTWLEWNVKRDRHFRRRLEDLEPELFRLNVEDVGSSDSPHHVKELWAQIDGPHLLRIRFVAVYEGQEGQQEESLTTELTYSGNYTVWWQVDGAEDDGVAE